MKNFYSALMFICVILLFAGQFAFAADSDGTDTMENSKGTYVIGKGDILEIITWKEPDFSREAVMVRLDGKISFPLMNDVVAAGLTPTQLKLKIEGKLNAYVSRPSVTVTVMDPVSQKFYILGEVVNVGEYPLSKELTVLQAFALAGGFTEWASKKEIILFRKDLNKETVIRINYKDIVKKMNFKNNIQIRADDTIIVP